MVIQGFSHMSLATFLNDQVLEQSTFKQLEQQFLKHIQEKSQKNLLSNCHCKLYVFEELLFWLPQRLFINMHFIIF